FLHYRQCRQEEFLQVVTAAAAAEAPLAQALGAYLRDRPRGPLHEFWVMLLLFFVFPGYYWVWYRRSNYDDKLERVAILLEEGHSLHPALRETPGVASRTTLLAVALGEQTGQLARCLQALHNPARNRVALLWLEMVPRFAYPLFLLWLICGILQFWTTYILPKYERILNDFQLSLPDATERVRELSEFSPEDAWVLGLAGPGLACLVRRLLLSPTVGWCFPVGGHRHRGYVRSQILHALAFLLQLQRPAPEALGLLAASGSFVAPARRRLEAVRRRVER